jgi:hypothetical protein
MTADPITSTSSASDAIARDTVPDTARGSGIASVQATATHAAFDLPAIASPETQEPARLIVGPPLPEFLARGLVIIQYCAENLRIVPVFGSAALEVKPRIGHIHVTVDDAGWHWADASGEQLIIQGLEPGLHSVRIDLADPTHRVIDSQTVRLEIPPRAAAR